MARMPQQAPTDSPPGDVEAVRERILRSLDDMPKRLRQCAEFVLRHPERIAVSTVAELAAGAEVQPSALMRFCQVIGFSGFSQMQKLYREAYAQRWPDYATRLERLRERDETTSQLLLDFAGASHKSLNLLTETIDQAALGRVAQLLAQAHTVHLVGLRRSFPVTSYLFYVLQKMDVPVVLHGAPGALSTDGAIRKGDAAVVITVAPYSPEAVALARRAVERGAALVSITDGTDSPVAQLPGETLWIREVDVGAFRTLAATMTLATTLAVAVGTERARRTPLHPAAE